VRLFFFWKRETSGIFPFWVSDQSTYFDEVSSRNRIRKKVKREQVPVGIKTNKKKKEKQKKYSSSCNKNSPLLP